MNHLKNIKIKQLELRVRDLEAMHSFYETVLGLKLISQTSDTIELGVDGTPLITLRGSKRYVIPQQNTAGLYHLALLLPEEGYLGQFLRHLVQVNQPITGMGDHLYSQAIYLNDPEGNGIEVYADRIRSLWTIDDAGMIEGGTRAVDVEKLMSLAYDTPWQGMPEGTLLGHVHLQVPNIDIARTFYIDTLGFELKTEMPQAIFVSKDGYHHHLGINAWAGSKLDNPSPEHTGMASFTISLDDLESYRQELLDQGVEVCDNGGHHFTIFDPFHIKIIFEKNEYDIMGV